MTSTTITRSISTTSMPSKEAALAARPWDGNRRGGSSGSIYTPRLLKFSSQHHRLPLLFLLGVLVQFSFLSSPSSTCVVADHDNGKEVYYDGYDFSYKNDDKPRLDPGGEMKLPDHRFILSRSGSHLYTFGNVESVSGLNVAGPPSTTDFKVYEFAPDLKEGWRLAKDGNTFQEDARPVIPKNPEYCRCTPISRFNPKCRLCEPQIVSIDSTTFVYAREHFSKTTQLFSYELYLNELLPTKEKTGVWTATSLGYVSELTDGGGGRIVKTISWNEAAFEKVNGKFDWFSQQFVTVLDDNKILTRTRAPGARSSTSFIVTLHERSSPGIWSKTEFGSFPITQRSALSYHDKNTLLFLVEKPKVTRYGVAPGKSNAKLILYDKPTSDAKWPTSPTLQVDLASPNDCLFWFDNDSTLMMTRSFSVIQNKRAPTSIQFHARHPTTKTLDAVGISFEIPQDEAPWSEAAIVPDRGEVLLFSDYKIQTMKIVTSVEDNVSSLVLLGTLPLVYTESESDDGYYEDGYSFESFSPDLREVTKDTFTVVGLRTSASTCGCRECIYDSDEVYIYENTPPFALIRRYWETGKQNYGWYTLRLNEGPFSFEQDVYYSWGEYYGPLTLDPLSLYLNAPNGTRALIGIFPDSARYGYSGSHLSTVRFAGTTAIVNHHDSKEIFRTFYLRKYLPSDLPSSAPTTSKEVLLELDDFVLVDAMKNTAIRPIVDGDVFDVAAVGKYLTVKIEEAGGNTNIHSVVYDFNGVKGYRTERVSPYTLGGDNPKNENYFRAPLRAGRDLSISATPYADEERQNAGPTKTVTLRLYNRGFAVVQFMLVDSVSEKDLGVLNYGTVLSVSALGVSSTAHLSIRAETSGLLMDKVVFRLDDKEDYSAIVKPYVLGGASMQLEIGTHYLEAVGVRGKLAGVPWKVQFELTA